MRKDVKASMPCPCGSGSSYGACCRPFHTGEREAPTAEALMRSRYAAFAVGDVDYLWKTLAPEHDDREQPEAEVLAALREGARACNFMKLEVHDAQEQGDTAEVEFSARIFEKGKDRSFRERSVFRRVDGAWRYVGAKTLDPPGPGEE